MAETAPTPPASCLMLRRALPAALLLLLIAAARIMLLGGLEIGVDEAWSIWQGMGSPADILRWTPYDWPPLYYLSLAGWRAAIGMHPILLRSLSVLIFLPGAAATYRIARRWGGERAGLLAMLAYGGPGYSLFLTTELRGYAPAMGLLPVAFWLTLRYFDRPSFRRGVLLGFVLAAMFYVTFTSAVAFVVLGLFTAIVCGRRIWRWWLPVVALLALAAPLILAKLALVASRTTATRELILAPFAEALGLLFRSVAGLHAAGWAVLLLVASGLLLLRWRTMPARLRRPALGLLLWWLGGAATMYALNNLLGFFGPRYSWWLMLGLALWLGWGLAYLPRAGGALAGAAMAVFMLAPGDLYAAYQIPGEPLAANLAWLAGHSQPGDVVVLDPHNDCASPEEWAYLSQVFLPQGPAFVAAPGEHRRVWYVTYDQSEDAALRDAVREGRVPGVYVGPPRCLIRLYEGPPDPQGILFANGMRFHGMDILEDSRGPFIVRHEGEPVRVRLWWSAGRPVDGDYSIGLHLLDEDGALLSQHDSGPLALDAPGETSTWLPGRFYVEEREVAVPYPLNRMSRLLLELVVYRWQDGTRIAAPGAGEDGALPLGEVFVAAW